MENRNKKVLRELMAEAAASAGSVVASDRTTNKLSFLDAPLSSSPLQPHNTREDGVVG